MVNKGDLLFVIDPRPFEAELSLAKATLSQSNSQLVQARAQLEEANAQKEQTQAQLELAFAQVKRTRSLKSKNVTTQDELDQLEAAFLQAKANVEASQAGISFVLSFHRRLSFRGHFSDDVVGIPNFTMMPN